MTSQNFLIGPIKEGLRKDQKPWSIPEDSFEILINAFQFRGRLRRRLGYNLLARLSTDGGITIPALPVMGLRTQEEFGIDQQNLIAFDTQNSYLFNGTTLQFSLLPSIMPVTWSGTDYQFFWTLNYAGGFWTTNSKPGLNGFLVSNAVAGSGITTITTTLPNGFSSGESVSLVNLGGMNPYLKTNNGGINGGTFVIMVTGPTTFTIPVEATGTYTSGGIAINSYVTVSGQDGIRYYGDLTNGQGWANYNPPIDPNNALAGALMIFSYRGYLVFLNTTEGNDAATFNYGNRARWTQIGTPYYSEPVPQTPNPQNVDPLTARDDIFGRGGANDAPTTEVIVTAEFIRDILVVEFERSTWRLRFVNNSQNPFVWERVNKELGSQCTFSGIPFDKGLMSIGNRGIIITDGNDTSRFDEKIPDDIFQIRQSNNGFQRVYGIRTFETRLNYWTFPYAQGPLGDEGIYPDKVLVFNYESKNWSFFDDTFTCFGYYYPSSPATTWESLTDAWSSYTNLSWDSGSAQSEDEQIIAGNQQGYVLLLEQGMVNGPSLYISNIVAGAPDDPAIFTSPNNNLSDQTWITLSEVDGVTSTDGVSLNGRNFLLSNPTQDPDDFTINEFESTQALYQATGSSYQNLNPDNIPVPIVQWNNMIPGSIQINVSTLVFSDPAANGVLEEVSGGGSGTFNYITGIVNLVFTTPISSSNVYVRIVSYDPSQGIDPVNIIGSYISNSGQIAKISNFDIQSKVFNFLPEDKRVRLSRIDFYVDSTAQGQFTANIFGDSSNIPINAPNTVGPLTNPMSNVVLTTISPNQIGQGDETIFRLYANCIAQTIQIQLTMNPQQMATSLINRSEMQLLAMNFSIRKGGRLI